MSSTRLKRLHYDAALPGPKRKQHFRTFCGSFTTEKFISMIRVFLQLSSAQNPFKVQEKKKIPHILLEDDLFKIFRK